MANRLNLPEPDSGTFSRIKAELEKNPLRLIPSKQGGPANRIIFGPEPPSGKRNKYRVAATKQYSRIG